MTDTRSWFTDPAATREHTITLAGTTETATVTMKPLNAGDMAAVNELKIGGEGGARIPLGEAKLLTVELAIVAWSFDVPPTRDSLRQLNPHVFEQMFQLVDVGGIEDEDGANGTGPTPAARAAEAKVAAETT